MDAMAGWGKTYDVKPPKPMEAMPLKVTSMLRNCLCTILFLALTPLLQAADPAGTWTWETPGRQGGEPRKSTLKLKVEGTKLLGSITTPGRQGGDPVVTEISEGKVNGAEISFAVVREFNGNKFTMKYKGKVEGDAIKGTIESERDGNVRTRDWEAKRAPAKT
jgi:hypothetical protein